MLKNLLLIIVPVFIFLLSFNSAKAFTVCAVMESEYTLSSGASGNCGSTITGINTVEVQQFLVNNPPIFTGWNFSRANTGSNYSAHIQAKDPDGNEVFWEVNADSDRCTNNMECTTQGDEDCGNTWDDNKHFWTTWVDDKIEWGADAMDNLKAERTFIRNQKKFDFGIAGNTSKCFFDVTIRDRFNESEGLATTKTFWVETNPLPEIIINSYSNPFEPTEDNYQFTFSFEAKSVYTDNYPLELEITVEPSEYTSIEDWFNSFGIDDFKVVQALGENEERFKQVEDGTKYEYNIIGNFKPHQVVIQGKHSYSIDVKIKVTDVNDNVSEENATLTIKNNAPTITPDCEDFSDLSNINIETDEQFICDISMVDTAGQHLNFYYKLPEGLRSNQHTTSLGYPYLIIGDRPIECAPNCPEFYVKAIDQFGAETKVDLNFNITTVCGDGRVQSPNDSGDNEVCDRYESDPITGLNGWSCFNAYGTIGCSSDCKSRTCSGGGGGTPGQLYEGICGDSDTQGPEECDAISACCIERNTTTGIGCKFECTSSNYSEANIGFGSLPIDSIELANNETTQMKIPACRVHYDLNMRLESIGDLAPLPNLAIIFITDTSGSMKYSQPTNGRESDGNMPAIKTALDNVLDSLHDKAKESPGSTIKVALLESNNGFTDYDSYDEQTVFRDISNLINNDYLKNVVALYDYGSASSGGGGGDNNNRVIDIADQMFNDSSLSGYSKIIVALADNRNYNRDHLHSVKRYGEVYTISYERDYDYEICDMSSGTRCDISMDASIDNYTNDYAYLGGPNISGVYRKIIEQATVAPAGEVTIIFGNSTSHTVSTNDFGNKIFQLDNICSDSPRSIPLSVEFNGGGKVKFSEAKFEYCEVCN